MTCGGDGDVSQVGQLKCERSHYHRRSQKPLHSGSWKGKSNGNPG